MRKKSEVIDKFIQFVEECRVDGIKVKLLRSDSGGGYSSDEMQAYCRYSGIAQEWSPPHCQSANGTSEVYWRETFKLVRSILWDQQRSSTFWASALQFANTIRNHLLTSAVPDHPPEAVWQRKPVDTSHFRVPLSDCYAFIEKENRETPRTLAERRAKCILVGYEPRAGSYLVFEPNTKQVLSRRYADVLFPNEASKAPSDVDPEVDAIESVLAQMDLAEAQREEAIAKAELDSTSRAKPLRHDPKQRERHLGENAKRPDSRPARQEVLHLCSSISRTAARVHGLVPGPDLRVRRR